MAEDTPQTKYVATMMYTDTPEIRIDFKVGFLPTATLRAELDEFDNFERFQEFLSGNPDWN